MQEDHKLIQQRKQKWQLWQEKGYDYAEKFDRTHTTQEAQEHAGNITLRSAESVLENPSSSVRMCGRILNMRHMGKLSFVRIRDGYGDFQICLSKNVLDDAYTDFIKILDLGDFCGFAGEFFITKHGEPTLLAQSVLPLSKSLRPLPEKFHGIHDKELCYRKRYLDILMNQETFQRFQVRSRVIQFIRQFLMEKGFLEIETRTLVPQAGGAMAKVFETHHEALDTDFSLRIALELDLKMAVVGGYERVFEIGKCFRNEGMDPSHLQEFTMLEWYAAYKDLEENMAWTQEMILMVLENVLGTKKVNIQTKNKDMLEIDFSKTWKRKNFADLLLEYAGLNMFEASDSDIRTKAREVGIDAKDIEKTGRANLLDDIYKKTARPHLLEPTFVMNYPSELKPLARPNGDGTASCAQLLVAGWEITNAYGELVDPQLQRSLLEDQAKAKSAGDEEAMDVNEEFLQAMEYGMPPMTGFGMGIDRFVTLITQQDNLRDTVLFPLMKRE